MTKLMISAAAAALALGAAAPSSAYTLLFEPGAASPDTGFTVVENFNNGTLGGFTTTTPGLALVQTGSNGNGAALPNSAPGGTPYLTVLTNGNATYSFGPGGVSAFQFDWGSIDTYNTLTFRMSMLASNGTMTEVVVPGSQAFSSTPANGNQQNANTNGRFTVRADTGETLTGLTLASSGNSFEIDNLAVAPVPEPATWGLMLAGFGMVGAGLRSRRRSSTVTYA